VDALKETFSGELAQVAPDGVFGNVEFAAQIFRNDLTRFAEGLEDVFSTVAGEHSSTIA